MCNSSSSNARHAFNYEHGDCDTRAAVAPIARHVCGHSEQSARREKQSKRDENVGQANEDDPLWIKGNLQLSKQIIKCGQHFLFQFNRFESEIPSIKCPNSKAISSGFLFFECSSTGPIRDAHTQVEELMDRPATKCLIQGGGGCRDRDMWQCEELRLLLPLCYY